MKNILFVLFLACFLCGCAVGTGAPVDKSKCSVCLGEGKVECYECEGTGISDDLCYACGGAGKTSTTITCSVCNGKGGPSCAACQGRGLKTCTRCKGTGNR